MRRLRDEEKDRPDPKEYVPLRDKAMSTWGPCWKTGLHNRLGQNTVGQVPG